MKTVLPTDGYSSASEFMSALQGTQGDAFWLLKSQGHWHGGLHLFDSFVPGAIYRPDGPAGHGLKSMTDGHIVAYRLNDDYRAAVHNKRALKFSTTFILVKSTCVPDKARPAHGLDFYTLWMQLAPLSVYGASDTVIGEVAATALKVRRDNPAPGWVRQGLPGGDGAQARTCYDVQNRYPAPRDTYTQLPRLSTVEILEEATFLLDRRAVPFVYVRVMSVPEGVSAGLAVGESGWISGQEKYLKRRGGAGALPRWMKAARQKGVFNEVVALAGDNVLPVSAGEIIGHLGYLESPHSAPHHFCHLEMFSQDSRLPDFVANRAGVTAGEPFIHSPRGKPRYFHRERDNTFEALAIGDDPVLTGEDRFTPRSKTRWQKSGDSAWYEIPAEQSWLAESDVTVVNQFDLAKRGFILLEQDEPPRTVRQTPREGWLRQGFQRLAELAQQNTRDMYSLTYIEGYQRLLKEMEFESDGEKFSKRLWQFLHNRQSHILKQVQRLIVKHHSEWLHDGMSALWRAALDEQGKYQPALALYNRQFIDALVWMKDVPEIRSSEALWHLHPVTFLEAIAQNTQEIIYWELGKTSERYESAGRGPGVISTGRGDYGGVSYGRYQFSSKLKVVHKFISCSKFNKEFDRLEPATAEFNNKWKLISETYRDEFSKEQHDYIKNTHYDVQMNFLKRNGIIITNSNAAIHDLVWSTSVQIGPATTLIIRALAGRVFQNLSEKDVITLVQDYKHDHVEEIFKSSPKLWNDLRSRAKNEKRDLLKLLAENREIAL
ncbi:hypothetical protein [Sodalis sp. RH16]|uniref:VgrG-related protein n=1 Tax=Sodalis sp. RH16 TaxID=3394331 RepID=UPI0039B6B541